MRGMRKPSPKKIGEANIRDTNNALYGLYRRMFAHVDFEFTEEMALASLVKPEDLEFVKRSNELFGYMRSSYYSQPCLTINAPSYANDEIILTFSRRLSFVPPGYMTGRCNIESLSPQFVQIIQPWLDQMVSLRLMYNTALKAWDQLGKLTDDDYARIRALWPTIDTLSNLMGRPVPKMPNPKGLPSPSPELREMLNVAETFVNAAMMMPEPQPKETLIRIELGRAGY